MRIGRDLKRAAGRKGKGNESQEDGKKEERGNETLVTNLRRTSEFHARNVTE